MLSKLIARFRGWWTRRNIDAEVDDELRFHLEMAAEAHRARGQSPDEARRAARRELGGVTQAHEAVRRERTLGVAALWADIRYALRRCRREPAFTATAVLTLALGIGANVAIFSVLDAALLRPLPYRDADRLVDVHMMVPLALGGGLTPSFTRGRYAANLRALPQVFEDVSAYSDSSAESPSPFDPRVEVGGLAPGLTEFLGVPPRIGRTFTTADLGSEAVLISDSYWRRALGGDPAALGEPVRLADGVHIVVGVMPPTFRYFVGGDTDAWRPVAEADASTVVARLRPGLTVEQAQRDLDAALEASGATWQRGGLRLLPAEWNRGEDSARVMLYVLLGAVGFLLLIACANVANMLLARTLTRRREIAVRGALGATRGRLVRQFLTEGLVLSGLGGLVATMVAWLGIRLIPAIVPADLTYTILGVAPPQLDLRVLGAAFAATLATGALCAVVPALRAQRAMTSGDLGAGQRAAGSIEHRRLSRTFQALQVALTLVLLVGAGLLTEALIRMTTRAPGFDADGLAYVSLRYPDNDPDTRRVFNEALRRRMATLPGIQAVADSPSPAAGYQGGVAVPEGVALEARWTTTAEYFSVRPGYFRLTGIPILHGRSFVPEDVTDEPTVAIVSEDVATRLWPGQAALGKRLRRRERSEPLTVVGVAGNTKTWRIAEDPPVVYEVMGRQDSGVGLVFRTTGDQGTIFASVVSLVRAIAPDVRVHRIRSVEQVYAESDPLGPTRFYTALVSLLAGVGLLTAAVGLFGLLSYAVSGRTHEIGVRMALGASTARLRRAIVADALAPVAAGLVLGLVMAMWLIGFVTAEHPTVKPHDPFTLGAVVLLFLAVAAAAAFGPVRRATRIDPISVLKRE